MPQDGMICLGVITGAKGIRGEVKIKSFTEHPEDLTAYGPLFDASGNTAFRIKAVGQAKGLLVARIDGVSDRNQAEALKGTELYVSRDKLPDVDEEDAFYYADLIGLDVVLKENGSLFGKVVQIHDFGAGDMLEVQKKGTTGARNTVLFPFTKELVPLVDGKEGQIVVDPPEGYFDRPEGEAKEERQQDGRTDKAS